VKLRFIRRHQPELGLIQCISWMHPFQHARRAGWHRVSRSPEEASRLSFSLERADLQPLLWKAYVRLRPSRD